METYDDVLALRNSLYQRAYRLTRHSHDAEDLTQETLALAWRYWASYTPGTNLHGWLLRILENKHVSNVRAKSTRPRETPYTSGAGGPVTRSAEDITLDQITDPAVKAALQALPTSFRTAVYYADVEGYSYREIADLMGTPVGTVMSRLYRGRTRLRTLLTHEAAA